MIDNKRFIHSIYHCIVCLFVAVLIIGCKTKKLVQYSGPAPDRSKSELMQALTDHNYNFKWYSCETGMRLDSPDEGVSGKAYIRMKHDSIIWSVVKKYSVEGVRTLITENTFAAVNRIDHTYQKGSTSKALSRMGVSLDFMDLQQALFGNVILLDSNTVEIIQEGEHYILKGIDQDLQLKYWINAHSLELEKTKLIDYLGRQIEVQYRDYRLIDSGQKLAFYRHYKVPYDDRGDAEIIMKVKKIEIDVPKKTRFSIPSHYQRIDSLR